MEAELQVGLVWVFLKSFYLFNSKHLSCLNEEKGAVPKAQKEGESQAAELSLRVELGNW